MKKVAYFSSIRCMATQRERERVSQNHKRMNQKKWSLKDRRLRERTTSPATCAICHAGMLWSALLSVLLVLPNGAQYAQAASPAVPARVQHDSALSTSCNKAFIPGRAGGFTEKSSPMACCVLDQALAMAWVLQSLLYCDRLRPGAFGARCNSAQAHFVKERLLECCPLFRPFYDPCRKHTQKALAMIENVDASMATCGESRGHSSNRGGTPPPLLPGILASSTASPVRFPQTLACTRTALLAARTFETLSAAAATVYSFNMGDDRTAYGKALMGVCAKGGEVPLFPDAHSYRLTGLHCAEKVVAFFRGKMHSKLWPIGIRSDEAYSPPVVDASH